MRTPWILTLLVAPIGVPATARADDIFVADPSWNAGYAPAPTTRKQWFGRIQFGLRSTAPSEQQDLLSMDGYDASPRIVVGADFTRLLTRSVGVGGWVDYAHRWATPASSGPTLTESVFAFGASVPVLPLGWESSGVLVAPKLGYGWSWMSFGGHAAPVGAIAYGAELGILWPRAHVTLTMGWLNGPTRAPGPLGRPSNFGGVSFLVGGTIDG